ncbi:hypothetical protein A2W15_06175 [Candidatus Woesebacteria bacterium RBG_16_41_13]|nr:MAG: hypothetical protein A2W15_06175 [Candidatus Woesebacteria bacterium RBG_16_41_13]
MTQISKRQLRKEIEQSVYDIFWDTIVRIAKREEAESFFSEFLTRTERVNFTKRLAVAILLYKNYDWRTIGDILKVSMGTISKIDSKIDSLGFKTIFTKFEKEEKWRRFRENLSKVYLILTRGHKVAALGKEGVERLYLGKRKRRLF